MVVLKLCASKWFMSQSLYLVKIGYTPWCPGIISFTLIMYYRNYIFHKIRFLQCKLYHGTCWQLLERHSGKLQRQHDYSRKLQLFPVLWGAVLPEWGKLLGLWFHLQKGSSVHPQAVHTNETIFMCEWREIMHWFWAVECTRFPMKWTVVL